MPLIENIRFSSQIKAFVYRDVRKSPRLNFLLDAAGNLLRCVLPSYAPGRSRIAYQIFDQVADIAELTADKDGLYLNGSMLRGSRFLAQAFLEKNIIEMKLNRGFAPKDLIHISKTGQPLKTGIIDTIRDEEKASQLFESMRMGNVMLQLRSLGFASLLTSFSYLTYRLMALPSVSGNAYDMLFSVLLMLGIAGNSLLALKNQSLMIAGAKYEAPEARTATKELISGKNGPKVSVLVPSLNEPVHLLKGTLLAAARQNYENIEVVLLLDDAPGSASIAPTLKMVNAVNDILRGEGRSPRVKIFERKKYSNVLNQELNKADNLNAFLIHAMGRELLEAQNEEGKTYLIEKNMDEPLDRWKLKATGPLSFSPAKHIIVIDADYRLIPEFATETVALLEENEKLALVQTPQNLIAEKDTNIERVSGLTISSYWQTLKRGNAQNNSIFWGGTNCTIRMDALESIKTSRAGGIIQFIPTKNITEDLYTTLLLLQKGWDAAFIPRPMAEGMAIDSLPSHFQTYWRYVEGTTEATLEQLLPYLRANPKKIFSRQGFDLLAHGFQSLSGFTFGFFTIVSTLPLLGVNLPPVSAWIFAPLFALDTYLASLTSKLAIRSVRSRIPAKKYDHIKAAVLYGIQFPVYIHAMLTATVNLALGRRAQFLRTPKDGERPVLPLKFLGPLVGLAGLNLVSFVANLANCLEAGQGWYLQPALWSLFNFAYVSYGLHLFNGTKNTLKDLYGGLNNSIFAENKGKICPPSIISLPNELFVRADDRIPERPEKNIAKLQEA